MCSDLLAPHTGGRSSGAASEFRHAVDLEHLDLEVERAARRDAPRREALRPVALLSRDIQLANFPEAHAVASLGPAFDDALAGRVLGRLVGVLRAPELLPGLDDDARGAHLDAVEFFDDLV